MPVEPIKGRIPSEDVTQLMFRFFAVKQVLGVGKLTKVYRMSSTTSGLLYQTPPVTSYRVCEH